MRVRNLQTEHTAGEAGLIVVPGRRAADVANDVLIQLFEQRFGLGTSPVLVRHPVLQVAIRWAWDVELLVIGRSDDETGVWRVADAWPSEPIHFERIGVRAARDELGALLRATRSANLEPVWLVGATPRSPAPESPRTDPTDPFSLLERLGLPEIAVKLRALAKTRPGDAPLDALRADGFADLADRLSGMLPAPASMTAARR